MGRAGERAAERYLKNRRYRVLHRNLHLGRLGELDLVAERQGMLVLVEVKSRLAGEKLGGMMNITATKQAKLLALGEAYLQKYPGNYCSVRFDVIEVEFPDKRLRQPDIRHLEDAFRG